MGLTLDSSTMIAGERKGQSTADMLSGIRAVAGPELAALSVISVIELEHGIWRAKTAELMDDLFEAIPVYPSRSISRDWRRGSGGRPSGRASRFHSRIW
jgi:hypothetical protein